MNLNQVLVFGMGLMGGSLSLALKEVFPHIKIHAVVRSEKSKAIILKESLADVVYLESELGDNFDFLLYDLVVFSTPVSSILNFIKSLPKNGKTVFIDLGSTKASILSAVEAHYHGIKHNFIGTHPMCGSEKTGPESAEVNLYKHKLCILCKPPNGNKEALEFVQKLWEKLGARTAIMEPEVHDETLAYLSHLPHIVSSILVSIAGNNKSTQEEISKNEKPITGGGFRDMSRIAGTNPDMWISIFLENQKYIHQALSDFEEKLKDLKESFDPSRKIDETKIRKLWTEALISKQKIRKEI